MTQQKTATNVITVLPTNAAGQARDSRRQMRVLGGKPVPGERITLIRDTTKALLDVKKYKQSGTVVGNFGEHGEIVCVLFDHRKKPAKQQNV